MSDEEDKDDDVAEDWRASARKLHEERNPWLKGTGDIPPTALGTVTKRGSIEHLKPYQFPPGISGNPLGKALRKPTVSITKTLTNLLEQDPALQVEIAQFLIDCARGRVPPSGVKAIEAIREVMNRVDGPVLKRLETTIKADKTVIVHDGPAHPSLPEAEPQRDPGRDDPAA